jgi:2-polyprenyl-3-methyl-5-hydroxy-6-metoxy-1,4-benzoquinol methylase
MARRAVTALPPKMRGLKDKDWLKLLTRSIAHSQIDGVEFPRFPSRQLQAEFVGSADENALKEAFAFYVLVKDHARRLGRPVRPGSRLLDFGCGWGRFLRFFWKDVNEGDLYGCDVDASIVQVCHETGVPGEVTLIEPLGPLPYADRSMDIVMSYSVFTHLPQAVHLHWMRELARVMSPGATLCLTLEPRRFLDFIRTVPATSDIDWYRRLGTFKERVPELHASFDRGELVFLPTNEGVEATYGDAVVPLSFIREQWSPYFRVVDYIDDAKRFWQAVLVVQRI